MNKKIILGILIFVIILMSGCAKQTTQQTTQLKQPDKIEMQEYCGDGICQSKESCSSCPNDCGECDECYDSDYKPDCYANLGIKKRNIDVCFNPNIYKNEIDICIHHVAVGLKHYPYCEKISGSEWKGACFYDVNEAVGWKLPSSICAKIDHQAAREACYIFYVINNDIKENYICDNILQAARRETCLSRVEENKQK